MTGRGTVAIDCLHAELSPQVDRCAVVGVDVIRATTTALTAVDAGRRCFPVASLQAAFELAERLDDPLVAGELGGSKPYGFDIQNSPTEVLAQGEVHRPMILLSTSGTGLLCAAAARTPTYVACLRNWRAQARHLTASHEHVLLMGADTRGEFREEDQLCCARIAAHLVREGFAPTDEFTRRVLDRWASAKDDAFLPSRSVTYLRATGQEHDLQFVLDHVDDLPAVFTMREGEVVRTS